MTARQVHSILAAAVKRPDIIDVWRKNPKFLADRGIPPNSLDLAALWKFAGLTVKVRHNGLRQSFSNTFRLMRLYDLEVDIFSSYASFCASSGFGFGISADDRADKLIAFLKEWLDLSNSSHFLLWDMIRHERTMSTLCQTQLSKPCPPGTDSSLTSQQVLAESSVLNICGTTIQHEMKSDPRAIARQLRLGQMTTVRSTTGSRYYCYWVPSNHESIQILELDEFCHCVITFIDGKHTIRQLSSKLLHSRRVSKLFLKSIQSLLSMGLLNIQAV